MLKPALETHNVDGILVAEFWDCLRLDPAPVQDLRSGVREAREEWRAAGSGRRLERSRLRGLGRAGEFRGPASSCARQRGGRLVLCNVDPTVREVLRASKLDVFFEFAGDRADALRVIKETAASPASTAIRHSDRSRCSAQRPHCATEQAGAIASTVARPEPREGASCGATSKHRG